MREQSASTAGDRALERARAVKKANESKLLGYPNVVGVGVGRTVRAGRLTDEIGLIVLVQSKQPISQLAEEARIPAQIDGVPVDVQEIGRLTAHEPRG
jgi:hypothetical protein